MAGAQRNFGRLQERQKIKTFQVQFLGEKTIAESLDRQFITHPTPAGVYAYWTIRFLGIHHLLHST